MNTIVAASLLTKSYGKCSILDGLELLIERNTVYGLVGLNGAGKTTLLRILLGILKKDHGEVTVLGCDPWSHGAHFYKKIGVVLEHDGFWGNMTLRDNLDIYAAAKGLSKQDVLAYLECCWANTNVQSWLAKKVKDLSRGQKVQCSLCRAFMGEPELIFLDEPVIALDIDAYNHFCFLVRRAKERGATLIISSHQLEAIDDLCDTVGLLKDKKITELVNPSSQNQCWIITTTPDQDRFDSILEQLGAFEIEYDQYRYTFTVNNPHQAVPLLVKGLVDAGCALMEVRPLSNKFSTVIKRKYLH